MNLKAALRRLLLSAPNVFFKPPADGLFQAAEAVFQGISQEILGFSEILSRKWAVSLKKALRAPFCSSGEQKRLPEHNRARKCLPKRRPGSLFFRLSKNASQRRPGAGKLCADARVFVWGRPAADKTAAEAVMDSLKAHGGRGASRL